MFKRLDKIEEKIKGATSVNEDPALIKTMLN